MNFTNQQMEQAPILWQRLDVPGMESARLMGLENGWGLVGTAVFLHEASPCRLDYHINLDADWQTRAARVMGWVGTRSIAVDIRVERPSGGKNRWWLNDVEVPAVAGCIDIDLNFSPSTNLLPIRRLALAVGQSAEVRAAWLRFPSFTLEPFSQMYRHTRPGSYRYESSGGDFTAELTVNALGFVTDYPPGWQQVR